jgi:hypothetical protein
VVLAAGLVGVALTLVVTWLEPWGVDAGCS